MALQSELMVMSGPRCPKGGFNSNQEIVEMRKVLHHSLLCIEDQPNTQISLPPLELDSPIAHAFEESYTTSTCAQRKWSTFITLSFMSQSRECIHSTFVRSVSQHHGKSTECMPCAFTPFCSVDACKLGVCLSSLLYISCLLVHIAVLFVNHAFTNMGHPMYRWLHWKYHFT